MKKLSLILIYLLYSISSLRGMEPKKETLKYLGYFYYNQFEQRFTKFPEWGEIAKKDLKKTIQVMQRSSSIRKKDFDLSYFINCNHDRWAILMHASSYEAREKAALSLKCPFCEGKSPERCPFCKKVTRLLLRADEYEEFPNQRLLSRFMSNEQEHMRNLHDEIERCMHLFETLDPE